MVGRQPEQNAVNGDNREDALRVFENRVLRKIFGPKRNR
jgi:hypothetical protein